MRGWTILLAVLSATPAAAQERAVPYWASIAASQAIMRAGPDRSYPAIWVYQRRDLPLRVVQLLGPWRRVQEQDGTTGWMLAMLLSARRGAVVAGGTQRIREAPNEGARTLWQAEPGVVGRIARCDGRFCRFQVAERTGYIAESAIWGTNPGEAFR